jgi:aldehyde dehydrogenase (NAD+)
MVWEGNAASDADVHAAVLRAREAALAWDAVPPAEIVRCMNRLADAIDARAQTLADTIIAEVGKPRREAEEEVRRSAMIVRYYGTAPLGPEGKTLRSHDGKSSIETRRAPLGVVGLVLPWNFPVAIPIWKLAPALATRNAVLLKPAPQATSCAHVLLELLSELPDGLVQLLPGGKEPVTAILEAGVDGLSFTGSTSSGKEVGARALIHSAKFQGELGGKNPSVVLADADLDHAAATIAAASMGFAGQKCTATSRAIVEIGVAEAFTELLVEHVAALRVGDPNDGATDVGPLISEEAVDRVDGYVTRARQTGSRVLLGGQPLPDLGPQYYSPTVVDDVLPDSELAQHEVFGPVLAVFTTPSANEAIQLANDTAYGLAAAVFTSSLQGAELARRLRAGLVRVNGPTPGVDFNAPFSPDRQSGIGIAELGERGLEFFTRERTYTLSTAS